MNAPISVNHNHTSNEPSAQELARIWEGLLGIGSVGLDDNYFDLGGDSSLAVQLFSEIDKAFGVKLPLTTLYEAPTIRELMQVLRQEAPPARWSCLVPIQTGGQRPPLFCVHGAGGNVLIYRDLARQLGREQPVYGLQSKGLDGSCDPLTRIEEMASLYVSEIQKRFPHGPYFLSGYCLGGTIAYEMAQQLHARGEEIALLALFDTMNWDNLPALTSGRMALYNSQRFVFHAANFLKLNFEGKAKFLRGKAAALRSRIPVWQGMIAAKFAKNLPNRSSESRVLGRIWQANDAAILAYTPKPYAGSITDFRPMKQYHLYRKPKLKWEGLAGGGEKVITLPVYPAGMLMEPFVKHLATALKNLIDAAISKNEASESIAGSAEKSFHNA